MRKPYQAKTIAKFLIEAAEAAEPTICMTNSKLNSILYYVQAWYMIKYGTPKFEIEGILSVQICDSSGVILDLTSECDSEFDEFEKNNILINGVPKYRFEDRVVYPSRKSRKQNGDD